MMDSDPCFEHFLLLTLTLLPDISTPSQVSWLRGNQFDSLIESHWLRFESHLISKHLFKDIIYYRESESFYTDDQDLERQLSVSSLSPVANECLILTAWLMALSKVRHEEVGASQLFHGRLKCVWLLQICTLCGTRQVAELQDNTANISSK